MSATYPPTGSEPPVRAELVARVRRAIQQGTYEAPEKWAITLRRVLEILRAAHANPSQEAIAESRGAASLPGNTPLPSPPIPPPE